MSIKGSADVQLLPGPEATWINQRTQGIVASRTHSIVYPKNGGQFTGGQKIRLEIPSQDYWDTSLFTISMNVQLQSGIPSSHVTSNTYGNSTSFNTSFQDNPWVAQQRTAISPPLPFGNLANGMVTDPTNGLESHWLTTRNGVQSIFNRVRILQGSMVIADILDYNKLNRILKLTNLSKEHVKTSDFINEGVYNPEDWSQKKMARNFYSQAVAVGANATNYGQYWNIRLNTGFLEIDKYFPTKYTGQITFELYLEDPSNCLLSSVVGPFSDGNMPSSPIVPGGLAGTLAGLTTWTAAPSVGPLSAGASTVNGNPSFDLSAFTSYPQPNYLVTDVQAHVHFVIPIQEYDEEMLSTINEQGLTVMYSTWNQHTRQLQNPGRTVLSFQERSVSVRGGLCIMENNVDIGDIKTEFQFSANNIIEFQWKLGNLYQPAQPVQCQLGAGLALFELENFMGTVGNMQSSHLIDQRQFLTTLIQKTSANVIGSAVTDFDNATVNRTYENKKEMRCGNSMPNNFIMALNLEKSPGQLSGFNTSATNVDIELRLLLDYQNSAGGFAGLMPAAQYRKGNPTFVANQGNHVFQPSKYKCHDLTGPGWTGVTQGTGATVAGGGINTGFYALNQPDNLTYNGEAENANVLYTASELGFSATGGAVATTALTLPSGTFGGTALMNNRPVNRWPDSGQNSATWNKTAASTNYNAGRGLANGGITSTDFMFTKAPATNVLVTFFAYIDAQLNIMKVGQLEVLR
jgi:hypothetical protein